MNDAKIKFLLFIAQKMNNDQCVQILERIANFSSKPTVALANKSQRAWDELLHPRDPLGKFTDGAGGGLNQSERKKIDKIGHGQYKESESIRRLRSEISSERRHVEELLSRSPVEKMNDGERGFVERFYKKQRQLSEMIRDEKKERREGVLSEAARRSQKRMIKTYYEVDEDIDALEEKYADRSGPPDGELKFPPTKRGQKDKERYEKLKKYRKELDEQIDWDKMEPEDDAS